MAPTTQSLEADRPEGLAPYTQNTDPGACTPIAWAAWNKRMIQARTEQELRMKGLPVPWERIYWQGDGTPRDQSGKPYEPLTWKVNE